jgi:hypothetical protein
VASCHISIWSRWLQWVVRLSRNKSETPCCDNITFSSSPPFLGFPDTLQSFLTLLKQVLVLRNCCVPCQILTVPACHYHLWYCCQHHQCDNIALFSSLMHSDTLQSGPAHSALLVIPLRLCSALDPMVDSPTLIMTCYLVIQTLTDSRYSVPLIPHVCTAICNGTGQFGTSNRSPQFPT